MRYTDEQMIVASRLAYQDVDFDQDVNIAAPNMSVNEMLRWRQQNAPTKEKADEIQVIINQIAETSDPSAYSKWTIQDVKNDQHGSGMYACLIDTGDGDAIIAFRGSESDTLENIVKDWGMSDIGLLNNVLTPQQRAAQQYVSYINKTYGNKYRSFTLTGHSLGGNLAEHATITAPESMRISRCVNLDGPGFSNAYIVAHEAEIERMGDRISHYQWSWCGTLLNHLRNSDYRTISAKTPRKEHPIAADFFRHDLKNVELNEDGYVKPGARDHVAVLVEPLVDALDLSLFYHLPFWTTAGGVFTLNALFTLWERWSRNRFSGGAAAQYEINCAAVKAGAERLSDLSSKLKNIEEEMRRIQRELAFDSLSAAYVKSRLWSLTNGVGQDAGKLDKYSNKGRVCGEYYEQTEQKIAACYGA